MKLNRTPLKRFVLIVILSASLAYAGLPFVHGNEKAVDLMVNVFAILAGFLIAIMTLFSDMRFDEDANWRQIQVREDIQEQRYLKHSFLFYTYLAVLICVFIVVLLSSQDEYKNSLLVYGFEYVYLFLACISIFYSMFLPSNLIKIRKEELKKLMDKKKPKYPD